MLAMMTALWGMLALGWASAQYPTPEKLGSNYTLSLGAAFPVSENMPDKQASVAVGLSWYGPADWELGDNVVLGLSADWIPVERIDGKSVNIVPLLFNYKQYGIIGSWRVFVNLGLGVIGASDNIPVMKIDNGAQFGWTAGAGFDISNSLSGQARFIGGNNPGDDGLAIVTLGYRF